MAGRPPAATARAHRERLPCAVRAAADLDGPL